MACAILFGSIPEDLEELANLLMDLMNATSGSANIRQPSIPHPIVTREGGVLATDPRPRTHMRGLKHSRTI